MADKIFGADFTDEANPTGTMTLSANNGTQLVDVALSNLYKAIGNGTTSVAGVLETATDAEATTLSSTSVAITPSNLLQTVGRGITHGRMWNGRVIPSISGNNLVVSLKTHAGLDPSATDPVIVHLAAGYRQITSALSVTITAGTNSFNAGSSELATLECDYFVYLAWQVASSAVRIGIARFPYARLYSDFSATATNEKYGAFSTAPAATDQVAVVARIPAILSGGAGYTWTIPSLTNLNLVQEPVLETRILSWTPTHTRGTTNYTNVPTVTHSQYQIRGNMMIVYERHTQNGTPGGSGNQIFTIPFSSSISGASQNVHCFNSSTGAALTGIAGSLTNSFTLFLYDGTAQCNASQSYSTLGQIFI